MKILLLGFAKIKYTPYANLYLESIDREKNDVTFLYWNRDCKDEPLPYDDIDYCEFRCYQDDNVPKWTKLFNFLKFKGFVSKHLKNNKYDFIVVLSTLPGIIMSMSLLREYKGRYIYDYRDITYETRKSFRKKVHALVNSSAATIISSDGFREFLPESDKIHTTHNILVSSFEHRDEIRENRMTSEKIRISFWGLIRPLELNLTLIKKLGNDERFEVHYYGREQDIAFKLKEYVLENGINNVFFHGEYSAADRYDFAKSTDIINNLHGGRGGSRLMANRYYDGAIFRLPQICMEGSFMAQCAERAGIGIGLNPNSEDFVEKLVDFYTGLDRDAFDESCDKEVLRFSEEYHQCGALVRELLN